MKKLLLISFVLSLSGVFLLVRNRSCIMVAFSGLPEIVKEARQAGPITEVVFLYADKLCTTCPSGELIDQFNKSKVLFVITDRFSDQDIENFILAFQIRGPTIKGDLQCRNFMKRSCHCAGLDQWQRNLYIKLDDSGQVTRKELFN